MTGPLLDVVNSVWPFLVVITVIVFFHELGHYSVARRNGVRVEVFSIGFGREIVGWTDRAGTRWRIALVPLGGYVKMFGQASRESGCPLTDEESRISFDSKTVGQRFAIVLAGPLANFVLSILLFAGLFTLVGQNQTLPQASEIIDGGAAERGGMRPGDLILAIDGRAIDDFQDLQFIVSTSPGVPLAFTILRDGETNELVIAPDTVLEDDGFGNQRQSGRLGIALTAGSIVVERLAPLDALWEGVRETWVWITRIFDFVGKIFEGTQSSRDLAGPLGIAQVSSGFAELGVASLVLFMAILSVNLGLINLFPLPLLDGGHLMFYTVEIIRGRPLGARAQDLCQMVGLALVGTLFVFVTFNDLLRMGLFETLLGMGS